MAAPRIPPNLIDDVAKGIGDAFNFLQLDTILYLCTGGKHQINGYTNEKLPRWTVARNCIDGAERDGIIVLFLAYVLSALPASAPLYALVVKALPEAKNALPELQAQLSDVKIGLERTRAMLSDPAARSTVVRYKETLEGVDCGISLLDGYKGLHDCLHLLQIKQISLLIASTAAIGSDDVQSAALREYKDQVRTQVESAREVAKRLPDGPNLRSVENKWIDELETAAKFLQKSLDDANPSTAKIGIIRMSRVLQFQPPRLNDLILAAVEQLPFKELSKALSDLAALPDTDGATGELVNAQSALERLGQALIGRVGEHDEWQDIDKQIWVIEQLFSQTVDQTEDFTAAWPDLKTPLRTMADLSPESEWAKNVGSYSERIDLELLRLQSQETAQEPRPRNMLMNRFADLRSEARLRFFIVDQQLKRDCEALVGIGGPVRRILGEIGND